MVKLKEYQATCILCNHADEKTLKEIFDWKVTAKDFWRILNKRYRTFVSGETIVRNKLHRHYIEEHAELIIDVWMNNQSSDSIEVIKDH